MKAFLTTLILSLFASSALAVANSMTISGRLFKPDGSVLNSATVAFEFSVYDPAETCVLYREQSAVYDLSSSDGLFEHPLGTGTVGFGGSLLDVFNSSASSISCDGGGTYTPAGTNPYLLKIKFHDGTGWKTFTSTVPLRPIGQSMYAHRAGKVGELAASDLLTKPGVGCGAGSILNFDGTTVSCSNSVADGFLAGLSVDKLISAAGKYFDYKPNGVACNNNETLKYTTGTGWVCAAAAAGGGGSVNSVSANPPLSITGSATDPVVNMTASSAVTDGYLTQADWSTFNGKQNSNAELNGIAGIALTGIVQRTGAGAYTALGVSAPLNVTAGNLGISNISAGLITSGTLSQSVLPSTAVIDGGNSSAATMTVGTSSFQTLNLVTDGTTRVNIDKSGTVKISNALLMKSTTSVAGSTIDFANGNLFSTTSSCGAFTFHNIKDGGSYSFIVQGASSTTCSFLAFSDAGSTALTMHMPPDHGPTIPSKHTLYSLLVSGTHVYVTWIPGY
ncbi:hypothetical protein [Bdellovibrio reynosensis]|uniref:Cell wall anchor protein n=1 Tax=Bdellovibrio reynosensis TaxID=2835041 RepID=A0ABY4CGD3_9BACT|nr:hypothetical protein [Bdellovibrio reynosensis]UOF02623.1 hypothetical protein MNR06_06630 [Bdellovibrio reynosensis]